MKRKNTPAPSVEQHLSVEETAKRLDVHHVTVRRLVNRGDLRGVRIGTRLVIPASAITEYLEKHAA